MIEEAKAMFRLFRSFVLITIVVGAGVVGGYAGGILAALDLESARYAGPSSPSLGMPGVEAIAAPGPAGTFEHIGRTVDQFNAQLEENWRTWGSIGSYVFTQGLIEVKRAWSGPAARPSGGGAGNTSDI
jgi:hypothetical protein